MRRVREVEAQRFAIRLGHDAFTTHTLSPASIGRALQAADAFRRRLDGLGISRYRAVATSAVRESSNGRELVDAMWQESAIRLETIDGAEEARLVWLATRHRIPLDRTLWVLADLGGGSLEVSLIDGSGISWSATYPMGTVRLLEELKHEPATPSELRMLVERYTTQLELPRGVDPEGVILTGGNADALADLLGAPRDASGVSSMTAGELRRAFERLSALSLRERVEQLGLREDRADVIVPAALIFERVAELARADRLLVPRVGVREGVLLELAFEPGGRGAGEDG